MRTIILYESPTALRPGVLLGKPKREEKKSQISKNGTVWLEPMREFINCALLMQKVSRTKKVGSNFYLKDLLLSANLDFSFEALLAQARPPSAASTSFAISKMVNAFDKIRTYFKEAC